MSALSSRLLPLPVAIVALAATWALAAWQMSHRGGSGAALQAGVGSGAIVFAVWSLERSRRQRRRLLEEDQGARAVAASVLQEARGEAQARAAQLQSVLAGMSDGLTMFDAGWRLLHWNERFPALTGIPAETLRIAMPIEELMRSRAEGGELGVEWEFGRLRALGSQEGVGENQAQRFSERTCSNGRILELRHSAVPGGGIVTLYTDVTDRKRAEAALAQKYRFVAIVAHEIRTPLDAVVNGLSLLERAGLSPVQRHLAGSAREAGSALLELMQDVLELSKMEAGQLALRPSEFELRPLLQCVLDMFRLQAAARAIELVLEVAPAAPRRLYADSGRLRQILVNFVSNAVKFSRPGAVTLVAEPDFGNIRADLKLAVRDQGPRIPAKQAALLFQPFFRAESDAGVPGTGLGLAICERLASLMDASVGVGPASHAPEADGNEFWLTIKLEVEPELNLPACGGAAAALLQRRRANVLLVEDTGASNLMTATMLRREGHRVDVADDGPEAIRRATAAPYDAVFVDMCLPGISSTDVVRQIRALPSPAAAVPVVALTTRATPQDRARCAAVGMRAVLTKPVRQRQLSAALDRITCPLGDCADADPAAALSHGETARVARHRRPALDAMRWATLKEGLPPGGPAIRAALPNQNA